MGAETPVGVKRIAGGDAALVNIACYMRRLLTPVPFPADSTGLFSDAGRFVTAAVGCGGAVSPVRTFTGAVRRLSEYEVLTTLPMHRTIAWDESDEVSLLVPGCSMTYSWRVSGEAEYVYESPEYIASRGIVTLVVGMPSVRTTLAAVGVQTDGVAALRVTVRVAGESVAEVHYRIEPREPGSVRLCWFNRMGGLDYHTFGRPDTGYLEASREAFLNHDGYAAAPYGSPTVRNSRRDICRVCGWKDSPSFRLRRGCGVWRRRASSLRMSFRCRMRSVMVYPER